MDNKIIVGLYLVSIIMYLLIINFAASISFVAVKPAESFISSATRIGVGESASVSVERHRWYGTIYESVGENSRNVDLYLFRIIKMPISRNSVNYLMYHFFYFIIATGLLILIIIKKTRGTRF